MTSPLPELNVIACQRCRHKKIRCDRVKPTCKKCRQISEDCVYDAPRYGKRKHGVTFGSNMDISASSASSYIPGILNRLDALERSIRNTTSPISPFSTNLSNLSTTISQDNISDAPNAESKKSHTRQMDLKGYKFCADPVMNFLDEDIIISLETAVSWIHALYDAQSTLGLLLPISEDFMLTVPSIIDNPYVQVDVRVVILYYGALHHGMLLSPGLSTAEKNKYSLFFYRKTLRHMEQWLLQENFNELSLHVAFWMTHEAYSQLDFDLSHRIHGLACQIARDLGLLQLDAATPPSSLSTNFVQPSRDPRWPPDTMNTVYRDVHRIYFWHILIMNDFSFWHHLYRSSNIKSGTWKVDIPDLSTRQSLSDINKDTKIYFEASLRLSVIELRYSELEEEINSSASAAGLVSESDQLKIRDMLFDIYTVLTEANIVALMKEVSSKVNVWLYALLIWRTTSMVASFRRILPCSAVRPSKSNEYLEHHAAVRSIRAMQDLINSDEDVLYWNLGYLQTFFTPCLGILFGTILTTTLKSDAVEDLALTLWVQTVVSRCAEGRYELKSLEMYLRTINHYALNKLREKWPNFRPKTEGHLYWQSSSSTTTRNLRSTQVMASDASLSESAGIGPLHEDELEFLHRYGISIAGLSDEPFQTVLSLEKSILCEMDPHRHWWTFES